MSITIHGLTKFDEDSDGWYGVDLDGTLAYYESGDYDKFGPNHIGKPIPKMLKRVQDWLAEGKEVRIMTARAVDGEERIKVVKAWCKEHIGQELEVTAQKDYRMLELWDDRAKQVIKNTGEVVE